MGLARHDRGLLRTAALAALACALAVPALTPLAHAESTPAPSAAALKTSRAAAVAGTLTSFDGRPLLTAALVMSPEEHSAESVAGPGDVQIEPDGRFTFRNVPPGRYIIRARGQTERDGVSLFATFAVTVGSRDVGGIELTLRPGAIVEGVLAVAPSRTPRPDFQSLRVRAPMADGGIFGDSVTGTVNADGTFRLHGIMAGSHVLVVEGLPSSWTLESVSYRGRNYVDDAFEVAAGDHLRSVRIVLSAATAAVAGVVTDDEGHAVADCAVAAFPAREALWQPHNRHVRLTRTDAAGRFRLEGLPPAEYYIRAAPGLLETDLYDRHRLTRLAAGARRVSLAQGTTQMLDLKPATPTGSAASVPVSPIGAARD